MTVAGDALSIYAVITITELNYVIIIITVDKAEQTDDEYKRTLVSPIYSVLVSYRMNFDAFYPIGSLGVFVKVNAGTVELKRFWCKADRHDFNLLHTQSSGITLSCTEWFDLLKLSEEVTKEIDCFSSAGIYPTLLRKIGDRNVHVTVGVYKCTAIVSLQHHYKSSVDPAVVYPSVPSVTITEDEWSQFLETMKSINDLLYC